MINEDFYKQLNTITIKEIHSHIPKENYEDYKSVFVEYQTFTIYRPELNTEDCYCVIGFLKTSVKDKKTRIEQWGSQDYLYYYINKETFKIEKTNGIFNFIDLELKKEEAYKILMEKKDTYPPILRESKALLIELDILYNGIR